MNVHTHKHTILFVQRLDDLASVRQPSVLRREVQPLVLGRYDLIAHSWMALQFHNILLFVAPDVFSTMRKQKWDIHT